MSRAQLKKATITVLDGAAKGLVIPVLFNPTEYTFERANSYKSARVTLSVSFREYRTLREQLDDPRRESADKSKRRIVVGRDALWLIAAREYDDPTEWPRIAEANDLDDPREITPGQWLLLPPIEN